MLKYIYIFFQILTQERKRDYARFATYYFKILFFMKWNYINCELRKVMRNIPAWKNLSFPKYDVSCEMLGWYFCNSKIRHRLRLHTGYRVIRLTESHFLVYLRVSLMVSGLINIYLGLYDTYKAALAIDHAVFLCTWEMEAKFMFSNFSDKTCPISSY